MIYIGIDPGKKGAMAIFDTDNDRIRIYPFDAETYRLRLMLIEGQPSMCCLEHVSAMPGQGVVSMFTFGENFGLIQGLLTAFGIPYELVRPQKWKKEFSITADKNQAIDVCKRLFPNAILKRSERCKVDDSNFAEALLMAEYARRKL